MLICSIKFLPKKIGIIGLGYVGLPLAIEFGKKYLTVGFDINKNRISELKKGFDKTLEVNKNEFDRLQKYSNIKTVFNLPIKLFGSDILF